MDELTTLILCKNVPLNNSYELSIDFDTPAMQKSFFETYKAEEIGECNTSYLRINRSIEVPYHFDNMQGINYLYYNNPGDNKTYYYFITSKHYINPNNTRLDVILDVFQTYMFNYELGECFVEREHQDRFARIGEYSQPNYPSITEENIEIGDSYIEKKTIAATENHRVHPNLIFAYVYSTKNSFEWQGQEVKASQQTFVNGVGSNYYCFIIPLPVYSEDNLRVCVNEGDYTDTTVDGYGTSFISKLQDLSSTFKISITPIIPEFIDSITETTGDIKGETGKILTLNMSELTYWGNANVPQLGIIWYLKAQVNVNRGEILKDLFNFVNPLSVPVALSIHNTKSIDNEPKLKIWPYTLYNLQVGDRNIEWKPQYFITNGQPSKSIKIKAIKSASPTATTTIFPSEYKGNKYGNPDELFLVDYLTIPQTTDVWKNYKASQSASLYNGLLVQAGAGAIKVGTAYTFGGIGSAVSSLTGTATNIIGKLMKHQDLKNTPDTPRVSGDDMMSVTFNYGLNPTIQILEIPQVFKERAFNYFYRMGYLVNSYKEPKLKSRYYFNFIKTAQVEFKESSVDSDYIDDLIRIFNNGITIWHCRDINTFKDTFLDYTKENVEISLLQSEVE